MYLLLRSGGSGYASSDRLFGADQKVPHFFDIDFVVLIFLHGVVPGVAVLRLRRMGVWSRLRPDALDELLNDSHGTKKTVLCPHLATERFISDIVVTSNRDEAALMTTIVKQLPCSLDPELCLTVA